MGDILAKKIDQKYKNRIAEFWKELLLPNTFSITQLKSFAASLESLAIVHTMKNNDVDDYLSKNSINQW